MGHPNEVWFRAAGRDEGNSADLIHRHPAPTIRAVIFRVVPGLVTEFAGLRNGMESPQVFAGNNIEAPNILFETGHDDEFLEYRRTGGRRAKIALDATRQQS